MKTCQDCKQYIPCFKIVDARNNVPCEKFDDLFPEDDPDEIAPEGEVVVDLYKCNGFDINVCVGCPISIPHEYSPCCEEDEVCCEDVNKVVKCVKI